MNYTSEQQTVSEALVPQKQVQSLPPSEDSENSKQTQEGLNKIVESITTRLKELADATDSDKEHLMDRLRQQLGCNVEAAGHAKQMIEIADKYNAEFFHTPDGNPYVTHKVKEHYETVGTESRNYSDYLQGLFFNKTGKPPNPQAVTSAINALRAKAKFEGPELPIYVRVAPGKHGEIIYDLSNHDWQVIKVTGADWSVIDKSPIKFARYGGMAPQVTPVQGGDINRLWQCINVADEDRIIVIAWLVAAMRPEGPYPVLILQGGQGTGKSLIARILRSLVDPSTALLRTLPDNSRDLLITARNSWCPAYDNLSGLKAIVSDDICRLSTGGGSSCRQLYTDVDEIIIDVQRPVILNGIDAIATRSDLQERGLILQVPVIAKHKRRPEKEIIETFNKAKPEILGALLNIVSAAIQNLSTVKDQQWPRMADFAKWIVAAEPAMPCAKGTFLRRYGENQADAIEAQLEADPLAAAVRALMSDRTNYEGKASDLLKELGAKADEVDKGTTLSKSWPTKQSLKNHLMRLQGVLLSLGIQYEYGGHKEKGSLHTLKVVEASSVASGVSVTNAGTTLKPDDQSDDAKSISSGRKRLLHKAADDADDTDDKIPTLSVTTDATEIDSNDTSSEDLEV